MATNPAACEGADKRPTEKGEHPVVDATGSHPKPGGDVGGSTSVVAAHDEDPGHVDLGLLCPHLDLVMTPIDAPPVNCYSLGFVLR
jgi:hypothetical protein